MQSTVILSDGDPAEIEPLGLWAFDDLREKYLEGFEGPLYRFKATMPSGREIGDYIDISEMEADPQPPDYPDDESPAWIEYHSQRAAYLYKVEQAERYAKFKAECRKRVLDAQRSEVRARIKTPTDYLLVSNKAITPEVTLEEVAASARHSFPV